MKALNLLPLALLAGFISSCANKGDDDLYDVSNPYSAPEYAESTPMPSLPSDLNPAYDAPALFEETSVPEVAPLPTVTQKKITRPTTKPVIQPKASPTKSHVVVRGDTLWDLSRKYNVPIDKIKKANGMKSDTVVLGSKLLIPAP